MHEIAIACRAPRNMPESDGIRTCTVHNRHHAHRCVGQGCSATIYRATDDNHSTLGYVNRDGSLHTCPPWR